MRLVGGAWRIVEGGVAHGAPLPDISSADGLDPASLRRVFEPAPFEGTLKLSGGTPLDRG